MNLIQELTESGQELYSTALQEGIAIGLRESAAEIAKLREALTEIAQICSDHPAYLGDDATDEDMLREGGDAAEFTNMNRIAGAALYVTHKPKDFHDDKPDKPDERADRFVTTGPGDLDCASRSLRPK